MSVERMKKLTVFATRSDTDAIVRRLMHLRCVEIEAGEPDLDLLSLERFSCEEERLRLDESVKKIDSALVMLHKNTKKVKSISSRPSVKLSEFMKSSYEEAYATVDEVLKIKERLDELSRKADEIDRAIVSLTPWQRYDMPLSMTSTDKTSIILGCLPGAAADAGMKNDKAAGFRHALAEADAVLEIASRSNNVIYAALIVHKSRERQLSEILARFGFTKLSFKDMNGTATQEIARLEREATVCSKEARRLEARLYELSENTELCEMLRDVESTNLAAAENKQKLISDETVSKLSGWIPARMSGKAETILEKFGCAYELADPADGDDAPVLLRNNPFAVNFEWVVGMYSYPKYGRFDPTFIMSIFYFIIFGIMFADVGYGLLTTVACFAGVKLLKPKTGLKRSMLMFGFCGISSMIFGAVFGGWFGDMPFAIMTNMLGIKDAQAKFPFFNGLWFNPITDAMKFLIFSLAVGFVHIIAAMAVRCYILMKDKMWMDAVCETFPWWTVFAGAGIFFLNSTAGICVVIFGLLFVMFAAGRKKKGIFGKITGGLLGLYDIVNYFSDILSYSRILALGLASAVVAQVINLIGTMGSGVGGFIIMIVAFILGHLLNLAINLLGTFVHTSRLQYLEFFGKFYEDGGRPFKAAAPGEIYSDVEE